jgi:hypothetical protein
MRYIRGETEGKRLRGTDIGEKRDRGEQSGEREKKEE